MIEVRIPKEIREYKTKYFFNFTLRQSVTTFSAVLICVPLYFFGKQYLGEEITSWLILLIATPIMLAGWFSYNQMTFERFLLVWFRFFWYSQKRPYQYLPVFSYIRDEYLKEQRTDILNRVTLKKGKESGERK